MVTVVIKQGVKVTEFVCRRNNATKRVQKESLVFRFCRIKNNKFKIKYILIVKILFCTKIIMEIMRTKKLRNLPQFKFTWKRSAENIKK